MSYRIALLRGDGIGPEVISAAIDVLNAVQDTTKGLNFHMVECDAGNYCIPKYKTNLPEYTIDILKECDAALKGPITTIENPKAPPSVTVALRKMFDLYANVRPAKSLPNVSSVAKNVDLVIVDSLSRFYRDRLQEMGSEANEKLITILRKLHKFVDKNIPVIVASNLGQKEDIEKAMGLGAKDYIVKTDFAITGLVAKLQSLIGPAS